MGVTTSRHALMSARLAIGAVFALVAGGCGSGSSTVFASAPTEPASTTTTTSDHAEVSTVELPGFLPAPGWETVNTPQTFSATTANVALGPGTLSGDMPWDPVERLDDGDVVLLAMFIAPSSSWGDDAARVFPTRSLPLSLDDALTDINFEGQPDHIYADRLAVTVNGWAIDLLVFYGGGNPTAVPPVRAQPSAETRAAPKSNWRDSSYRLAPDAQLPIGADARGTSWSAVLQRGRTRTGSMRAG